MDFTNFYNGVDMLAKEKQLQAEITSLSKDGKEYNADPKVLKRVKDYVHYYMNDWDCGDPFTPLADCDYKCKLVQPFRKMRLAILDLKETGRLDLLAPILSALDSDGIHIEIDESVVDNKEALNQIIEGMNAIQTSVCAVSDERKELTQKVEDEGICTKGCFNKTIKQMYRVEKDDEKTDDAVSKIYESIILNNRDNDVFGEFVKEHEVINE